MSHEINDSIFLSDIVRMYTYGQLYNNNLT